MDIEITRGYVHSEGELGESEEAYLIFGLDLRFLIPFIYQVAIVATVGGFVFLIFAENTGKIVGKKVKKWRKKRNS